jgi:hypothetical protein
MVGRVSNAINSVVIAHRKRPQLIRPEAIDRALRVTPP